ncbi:MAG: glycosyl hydrolase, partial [Solirubrobacteraceae bacterium]
MGRRTALVAALVAAVAAIALVAWAVRRGGEPLGKFEVRPGCPAPATRPPPRDRRGSDLVAVTSRERQTITGWGASVVSDTFIDPLVDTGGLSPGQLRELDRLVFAEAGIDIVRVFGPGFGRARVSAPARDRVRDRSFAFMRRIAANGVRFMYTGADAPPALKDGRRLRTEGERPLARYVAGYLRFAREVVGVGFDYAAIANEPDNRSSRLTMTPEQSARVYAALAGELDRQGMATRLVLGDTTGWGTACPYVSAQLARGRARSRAVAVASHPYYGSGDEARAVAEQARRAGVEVWQTEYGTGCATCSEDDSIHRAIGWSRKIVSDLTKAQVSAWFAFRAVADSTHGPGDALLVRVRRDR